MKKYHVVGDNTASTYLFQQGFSVLHEVTRHGNNYFVIYQKPSEYQQTFALLSDQLGLVNEFSLSSVDTPFMTPGPGSTVVFAHENGQGEIVVQYYDTSAGSMLSEATLDTQYTSLNGIVYSASKGLLVAAGNKVKTVSLSGGNVSPESGHIVFDAPIEVIGPDLLVGTADNKVHRLGTGSSTSYTTYQADEVVRQLESTPYFDFVLTESSLIVLDGMTEVMRTSGTHVTHIEQGYSRLVTVSNVGGLLASSIEPS